MKQWILWIVWISLAIGSFAVIEAYGVNYPEKQWTLSKFMSLLGQDWPMTIFLAGLVCGGLAVHFWWHYCP